MSSDLRGSERTASAEDCLGDVSSREGERLVSPKRDAEDGFDAFVVKKQKRHRKQAANAPQPSKSHPSNNNAANEDPSNIPSINNQSNTLLNASKASEEVESRPRPLQAAFTATFASDELVPVTVAETPAIIRNRVLRNEDAPMTAGPRPSPPLSLAQLALPINTTSTAPLNRRKSWRGSRISSSSTGIAKDLPHPDISPSEYYCHVDQELMEPLKMRQILIWCAKRVKEDRLKQAGGKCDPTMLKMYDSVIEGLINRSIDTSWYNIDDASVDVSSSSLTAVDPPTLLPHPENMANLARKAECEAEIEALLAEERAWHTLMAERRIPLDALDDPAALAPRESSAEAGDVQPVPAPEALACLTESEAAMLASARNVLSGALGSAVADVEEWAEEVARARQMQIHARLDEASALSRRVKFSARECDALFRGLIGAYETERKQIAEELEPMDVLRMLGAGGGSCDAEK
ncbi:Mis12-Mtw1 protein family-domain-containing protein [Chytriomyces sp. MP71]|nr:Mis12-Mtw1 protein family-domain-containing protein [Chytriomyces sp. MP71]